MSFGHARHALAGLALAVLTAGCGDEKIDTIP
jgi:hypothetical protein